MLYVFCLSLLKGCVLIASSSFLSPLLSPSLLFSSLSCPFTTYFLPSANPLYPPLAKPYSSRYLSARIVAPSPCRRRTCIASVIDRGVQDACDESMRAWHESGLQTGRVENMGCGIETGVAFERGGDVRCMIDMRMYVRLMVRRGLGER